MSEFAPVRRGWSAGAAGALLAAVWEGALLAALVWLVLRLLPGLARQPAPLFGSTSSF